MYLETQEHFPKGYCTNIKICETQAITQLINNMKKIYMNIGV
jgi:hypothetical protein